MKLNKKNIKESAKMIVRNHAEIVKYLMLAFILITVVLAGSANLRLSHSNRQSIERPINDQVIYHNK